MSPVSGPASGSLVFAAFIPEIRFPVRSHKRSALGAGSTSVVTASAASLVHSRAELVDSSVDRGVLEDVAPWGGTGSKILTRPVGAIGVPAAPSPLSAGAVRKSAEMIYISHPRTGR
ncbi:hypothetical protein GCM10010425_49800 [Streptomyces spororaveus]|uniref:Uncharacterized protein n=1 Tax=Streptomyces spororaveus TaxID=284039 RepID=A0ABQ3T2F4_9ACTN|nr:hypothetical protein Sspor_01350 [Streptomyces spororaveus]